VQYLAPVEDRWGEIALYPELLERYTPVSDHGSAALGVARIRMKLPSL
jgi:hypothetical protein